MKVVVLPIRLGDMAPSPVEKSCRDLYGHLAEVYFSTTGSGEQLELDYFRPLPIVSSHSLQPPIISELIVSAITARGVTLDSSILIDMGGPDERSLLKPTVVLGLNLAVTELLRLRSDLKIGLFIPKPLSPEDHAAGALRNTLANLQVRCLFGDGSHWGRFFDTRQVVSHEIKLALERAQTNPVDLLRNKIIRRVGHYRLGSSSKTYATYYDGSGATAEIFRVVRDVLIKTTAERKVSRIFFESSGWFDGPVLQALESTGHLPIANKIRRNDSVPELLSSETLLLLPIIRTGKTLRELIGPRGTRNGIQLPRVWTLLSTEGTDGVRFVPLRSNGSSSADVRVEYSVLVRGTNEWIQEQLSSLSFRGVHPDEEDLADQFHPSVMWAMILESGMIVEDEGGDVGRLGYVPNFERLAAANGAFLASKFQALLRKQFGSTLPELVFLCPAERHAQKLADCLRDLAGFSTISVKRPIIELFGPTTTLADVVQSFSATVEDRAVRQSYNQLRAISNVNERLEHYEKPSVVLLDEFTFSGRTTRKLYYVAKAFGLNVLCKISLANFGPESGQNDATKHFPFYRIDYQHCLTQIRD